MCQLSPVYCIWLFQVSLFYWCIWNTKVSAIPGQRYHSWLASLSAHPTNTSMLPIRSANNVNILGRVPKASATHAQTFAPNENSQSISISKKKYANHVLKARESLIGTSGKISARGCCTFRYKNRYHHKTQSIKAWSQVALFKNLFKPSMRRRLY